MFLPLFIKNQSVWCQIHKDEISKCAFECLQVARVFFSLICKGPVVTIEAGMGGGRSNSPPVATRCLLPISQTE